MTDTVTTDYPARRDHLQDGFRRLTDANQPLMRGFANLHRAAMADGALSGKTKELMALAIAIVTHCDGCIAYHTHDALKAGATRPEVEEAIGVAVMMGGGSAAVYGSDALDALDQFEAA